VVPQRRAAWRPAAGSPDGYALGSWDGRPLPRLPVRKAVPPEAVREHLCRVARSLRREITAVPDPHRIDEVLVQMVDVLDHPTGQVAADRDVIEDRQVLDELAQAHAARVRADGDTEAGRQQQHRQHFVDAAQAGRVRPGYVLPT